GGYSTPNNESDKLVVYDIANPSAPVKREVIATGADGILDFDLAGSRAYIVGDRFITVDLRTPGSAPVNGDPYGNRLSSIVVSGSYAFTGYPDSDGRLFVWDVTNPAQLTVVGNVTITPGETTTFTDLLTYGPDYLIGISDSTSGWDVVVIDRRNVDAPVRAGGLHIPQIAGFRGKIDGSMLYVAGGDGGVAMVDLSNPAAPHLVSVLNTPGLAFGIEAAGSTVIVADRAAGVSFLDSSTGTLRLTGAQAIPGDGWDVALGGGSLFIANDLGLATIENVLAPPRINASLISVGADGTTTGQPGAITGGAPLTVTVQNLATSATSSATANANGSFVVPITAAAGATITVKATDAQSRVAGPVVVGTVPYGVGTTVPITIPADPSFRARTLRLSGTLLAVAGYSNDYLSSQALVVYDVTNPAAPILRNTIFMQLGGIRDIELANGWAYVVGGGFTTVDLNSPDLTVHQPNFQLGQQQSIALAGGYAFVAPGYEAAGTVYVYDVTSPASPRFLTQFDTAPDESIVFNDLLMFGPDYLVGIGNGSTGPVVHVIDRRDVNNLHSIGKLSTGAIAGFRGKIVGSTLYVAGVAGGLAVVDLSIPSAPRLVSTTPTAGLAYGVDSSGTTILVADKSAGVSLFDTSTGSPHLLGTFSLANSNAWDVVLNGTTAYIANELSLGIIDNVAAAPQIELSSIAVAASTSTTATVTGVSAIHGKPPVTVQVRNEKTGTTSGSTPASATGSFTAIVTARPGEPLSIIARDGASRSTTASIGAVPFFTVVANERGGAEFDYYGLARRIGSDGATVVVSGGTLGGQFYSSSTLAQLFRLTPPSLATVDSGANFVFDSKVSGGYAFFAGDRFSTLSLTDPSPVANVAPADQCGFEYSVALSSHYAFTGSNECSEPSVGTINVYDVAAPAAPAYVRSQSMSPASNVVYRDLVATGTNVIFAISPDEQSDVTPIDVTNPGSLAAQPPFDIPGFTAFRGVLDGSTLYLAGGDAGVAVVDVSSPGAPVLRSIVNTPGVAFSVAVSATNEIIVADGGSGLTVVDTTDKLNPVVVGTQQLDGSAVDVKVIGNQIYAATETRFYVLTRP
ncbi:MAG: hypothetical protein ACXW2Q_02890, partial [Thermoanaerobaculia bacterium]